MCDEMTSHIYHINNGPVIHTTFSHSETRCNLNISDKDESYCEVEWKEDQDEPEIRFPGSWGNQQREDCLNWYLSRFSNNKELAKYVISRAIKVKIIPGYEDLAQHINPDKCKMLYCAYCTNLKQLPDLPNCEVLYCDCCTNLIELPDLPNCKILSCYNCKNLKQLPDLPNCKILDCQYCTKLKQLPDLPNCNIYCDK